MNKEKINILLSDKPLITSDCIDFVSLPNCGGINVFIGTVRDHTKGREVTRLEFEAYAPMAISEMRKLAEIACERWNVQRIAVHHRTGVLDIGEIPVIIAVACPHRKAAFEACQFVIDTLKQTVPIWKKEVYADGEIWVAAHP